MSINKEQALHAARLARIDLGGGATGAEADANSAAFVSRLAQVKEYVDILQELETTGVEPLFSLMQENPAPLALDEPQAEIACAEILRNAPAQEDGFFIVPRVL